MKHIHSICSALTALLVCVLFVPAAHAQKVRPDVEDSWRIRPLVQRNEQGLLPQSFLQVAVGDRITLSATPASDTITARYKWLSPAGKVLKRLGKDPALVIEQATEADMGIYTISVTMTFPSGGTRTEQYEYNVDVQTDEGAYYDWTQHTPHFSYYFRDEFPDLQKPTKSHNIKKKNGQPANRLDGEWWSVYWGDNLNSQARKSAADSSCFKNLIKKFDEDFGYIRDVMGWPPDLNPQNGWRSYVYIFGSGLEFDNTSNTEKGGYQGTYYVDGANYPCVTASYYPLGCFRDDASSVFSDAASQREAMIHEGIHAILASMAGCKQSAWFQEGGNTWLQAAMAIKRSGQTGTPGFLDACPALAPFMPIECYSGWLQDGSFGGPSAEGVNMYNSSGAQVCTWRNLIGGTQYSNFFPTVLAGTAGEGTIPWIWRYCPGRVLEGIADSIGDASMRELLLQYRARQAMFDFGDASLGFRNMTSSQFGTTVKEEWSPYWIKCTPHKLTPYQRPTRNDDDGWYAPDTLTNPGWSGANFVPVHVRGDRAEVEFRPQDTNMRAQMCFRTKTGETYYSQPVRCGTLSMDIATHKPSNGVVTIVIINSDYKYTGNAQRKHHWDYRLRLGEGALAFADNNCKWFLHEKNVLDKEFETGIESIEGKEGKEGYEGSEGSEGLRDQGSSAIHDLLGRPVNPANMSQGVYILHGKKIYVQ